MDLACIWQTHCLGLVHTNTTRGDVEHVKGLDVTISEISPITSNVTLDEFRTETSQDEAF